MSATAPVAIVVAVAPPKVVVVPAASEAAVTGAVVAAAPASGQPPLSKEAIAAANKSRWSVPRPEWKFPADDMQFLRVCGNRQVQMVVYHHFTFGCNANSCLWVYLSVTISGGLGLCCLPWPCFRGTPCYDPCKCTTRSEAQQMETHAMTNQPPNSGNSMYLALMEFDENDEQRAAPKRVETFVMGSDAGNNTDNTNRLFYNYQLVKSMFECESSLPPASSIAIDAKDGADARRRFTFDDVNKLMNQSREQYAASASRWYQSGYHVPTYLRNQEIIEKGGMFSAAGIAAMPIGAAAGGGGGFGIGGALPIAPAPLNTTAVTAELPKPNATPMGRFCSQCGSARVEMGKFCTHCGRQYD